MTETRKYETDLMFTWGHWYIDEPKGIKEAKNCADGCEQNVTRAYFAEHDQWAQLDAKFDTLKTGNPFLQNPNHAQDVEYVKRVMRRYASAAPPRSYSRKFECVMESGTYTNANVFDVMAAAMKAQTGKLAQGIKAFSRMDPLGDEWPASWLSTYEYGLELIAKKATDSAELDQLFRPSLT